ncbi:MAG: hypothetical protein IKO34_11820 [Bacteroidales bacterium]|nr:hypothetical protein [Bacteroidales bacterium]
MATVKKVIMVITLSLVAFGVQSQNIKQDIQRQKQQQEEREAERKAEAQRYIAMTREAVRKAYMQSDEYKILESISNDFDKWNIKDEFESTVAYEDRLKHQSIAKFYQICEENIRSFFERINIETELKQYDADKQYFPVEIYFVSQFCWDYTEGAHYTIAVPVSIEDAPKFKSDFRSRSWQKCEVYDMAFTDDIDNKLVPTKVSYNGREYNVPIENSREVTFSFSELGLYNQYCSDAVWNINVIKLAEEEKIRQEKEQRIQDSIVCIEYNRQLDSLVTAYNRKLLQDEYNFEKETVSYSPLRLYELEEKNIEYAFNEEQNRINEKYKSIMYTVDLDRKTVEDYKQTNFDNLKNFVFVDCVSPLPSGHNSHTYYYCPEYIYKNILVSRTYKKYSNELIAKLIEVTVDINTQLNNEWTKNGQYFENKVDFFDSYLKCSTGSRTINVNPKYESILKDKIYDKMPEEERHRLDSISCVEYNRRLDSIVSACNEKLRQEEYYNLKNEKVENVSLTSGKGIEDRFETEKDKVEKNFNTIMKGIEKNKKTIEDYKRINLDDIKSFSFANFVDDASNAYGRIITNQKPEYILEVRKGDLLNDRLIEFFVDTNKQLNKEWSKDGQYFENKVEFYGLYLKFGYHQVGVNPEYKTILKERKNSKK